MILNCGENDLVKHLGNQTLVRVVGVQTRQTKALINNSKIIN